MRLTLDTPAYNWACAMDGVLWPSWWKRVVINRINATWYLVGKHTLCHCHSLLLIVRVTFAQRSKSPINDLPGIQLARLKLCLSYPGEQALYISQSMSSSVDEWFRGDIHEKEREVNNGSWLYKCNSAAKEIIIDARQCDDHWILLVCTEEASSQLYQDAIPCGI